MACSLPPSVTALSWRGLFLHPWSFIPENINPLYKTSLGSQELSLQHITNVSWAYASLGVVVPRLAAALRTEVSRRLAAEQLSAQQLCNLLWALALLRVRPPLVCDL